MGKKQEQSFWSKKRIALIAAVVAVFLIAGGSMIYWVMTSQQQPTEGDASQVERDAAEKRASQAEADGQLQTEAAKQISSNNTQAADKLYQEAISAASTEERKTLLYIDLSAVYYKEQKYTEAFDVAKKAETLNPDKFLIADWLSRLYEDRKDYKTAESYYRLAAQWAQSPQNKTALSKQYYEAEANRVAGMKP